MVLTLRERRAGMKGVSEADSCCAQGADLDAWIAKVRSCEYLPENDLKMLCQMVGDFA